MTRAPTRGKALSSPPSREERAFDIWVHRVTERLDPLMAWLGVIFALVVGYEIAIELTAREERVLYAVGWGIWALFALELATKLYLAPRRLRFLRRHWFQAVALLLPTLRLVRFLRLLRIGRALPVARVLSSSYRSVGTAKRVVRSRLGYLAAMVGVVSIASAELAYAFERNHPNGIFDSFGDAIVWAITAVVAVQAQPIPASDGGRVVMLGSLLFGLVVVASLAGTIGAYLVEDRRERTGAGLWRS